MEAILVALQTRCRTTSATLPLMAFSPCTYENFVSDFRVCVLRDGEAAVGAQAAANSADSVVNGPMEVASPILTGESLCTC